MRTRLRLAFPVGLALGWAVIHPACAASPAKPPTTTASPPIDDSNTFFPETLVGHSVDAQFLFGTLSTPITLTGAFLTGPSATSYAIIGNTCTAGVVLQGATQCEIDVRFKPQAAAELDEYLELATTDGPFDRYIGTYGLAAPLLVSPTFIDFGSVSVGVPVARTVTLTNPNPIPVSYEYDYYGVNSSVGFDFLASTTTCGIIPADGSCTYQITFTPTTAGAETGSWFVVNGINDTRDQYHSTPVRFAGVGASGGSQNVDISKAYSVDAIGYDNLPVARGGLDGLGNVYASQLLSDPVFAAGQAFILGGASVSDAISGGRVAIPPRNYHAISMLGTGVRGNQQNQPFVVHYSDGSSTLIRQSLSDWRTPQFYAGESIGVSMAYRLTVDGLRKNGPYQLYAYTLPVDPARQVVGVTLPPSRSVVILGMNTQLTGVPATADLTTLYNVSAIKDSQPTPIVDGGIDGLGNAIDRQEILKAGSYPGSLRPVADGKPNAVANVTVPLPAGSYSSLRLLGMAVRGSQLNQTLTVKYQDGSANVLHQNFSDWHISQGYAGESIAVAMPLRLNSSGAVQKGLYDIYQYDLPLDSGKAVGSVTLPATRNVVILQVTVQP